MACSSSVGSRKGESMSLSRPDLLTRICTPMRSSASCTMGRYEITPIAPTIAAGSVITRCAAAAIMYPPEAPMPPT